MESMPDIRVNSKWIHIKCKNGKAQSHRLLKEDIAEVFFLLQDVERLSMAQKSSDNSGSC